MQRRRAPYAKRSVWYAVAVLSVVLVVAVAVLGYEVNHLRTELDKIQPQVNALKTEVAHLFQSLAAK
jgi:hypothetical protein